MSISLDKLKIKNENLIKLGLKPIEIKSLDLDHLDELIEEVNNYNCVSSGFLMLGYMISEKLYTDKFSKELEIYCRHFLLKDCLPAHLRYLFAKIMVSRNYIIGNSVELSKKIFSLVDKDRDEKEIGELKNIILNMHEYY